MFFSRNKLNRMSESEHPWWTPTVVLRNSPSWLFKRTLVLEFSHSAWMAWTGHSSMLKLLRTCYRPACQTQLNTFLKPMILYNRSSRGVVWQVCAHTTQGTRLKKPWAAVRQVVTPYHSSWWLKSCWSSLMRLTLKPSAKFEKSC